MAVVYLRLISVAKFDHHPSYKTPALAGRLLIDLTFRILMSSPTAW